MASSQAQEKGRSTLELTLLKKNGVRNAVNLLTLQWNDLDAYFDSTQRYLEEQFTELKSRENRLLSLQHSITDSNKHLDSIRQSLDERANQIQHKHLQFCSFQEEQINELKLKEKQLDVRGDKLAAHQRLIEGLFEKLDLEMKQFENIQKTVGEKLEEINLKEVQLESREVRFQSAQKSIKNVLESSSHGKRRTQQSEGESSKKHKISATEKISTPEKADFGSETLGLRRSPSDLQTRPGHSNGGEFTFSKENGSSCLANEKTNGRVDSSPNKVSEEVFHDFSQERSWEKLQNGQIWAMYKDRLPNTYVQIKNIKRYESGLVQLHIQSVQPCTMTQPLCCGRFKVQKGRAIYLQSNFFSHVVKADSISKMFLEIYPKKGQVWAIYRNWNADFSHSDLKNCYYDIVEVLDDSKQTMKVSPLVRVSGFMSVFRARREQISNTGVLVIPQGELLRFSHQIPAFQLTGEKEGKLRGYWELDFAAVPDPYLEEQGESMTASENMSTPQKADCERETNDERHGGFTLSKENTSLRSANEKTNGKVDSSPKKVSEEVFHDFTRERSCKKFQTGQIWAMYKDGLPIRYVQIKNITTYACGLHVQSLEPCTMTQPLHCGRFKVQKGKEFYSESSFSHIVKAVSISKMFFEIYPKKGQVWAIYRNWHGDLPHSDLKYYYDIAEVREDTEQSTEVSPLVRVSGFRSVFRAPEGQRSNTGVVVIPRTELGRFSHQIPAFQLTGEKEGKLKGYWELDPEALPGKI